MRHVGSADAIEQRLREVFRRTLREALAPGLALGLVACSDARPLSDDTEPSGGADVGGSGGRAGAAATGAAGGAPVGGAGGGPIDDGAGGIGGPFEPRRCSDRWNGATGLRPAAPTDFIAVWSNDNEVGRTGQDCATAADLPDCTARLTQLLRGSSNQGRFVVATQGDAVRAFDVFELPALLGSIDTAQEAALVAFLDGYDIACNDPQVGGVRRSVDGYEVAATKTSGGDCTLTRDLFVLLVRKNGFIGVVSKKETSPVVTCSPGRRPDGLAGIDGGSADEGPLGLGRFLVACAQLEASSVPAFLMLARDLEALDAPRPLIDDCLRSAADEIRHTRITAQLAKRRGGHFTPPTVPMRQHKTLAEIAAENVVEGCVRETFGALVATYQAEHAADPAIAEAMSEISEDETRHASLAWRIAYWVGQSLPDADRQELEARKRRAIAELRTEVSARHSDELHRQAGLPEPPVALALLEVLDRSLWRSDGSA